VAGLDFTIDVREPERRQILVSLEFERTDAIDEGGELVLFLPTWTPGSYLIREYSRHLARVEATDASDGTRLACRKVAKNRFALEPGPATRRLRVAYTVYAHDLSVRTADLTDEHAYWNHACVLLWPTGRTEIEARITILAPAGWEVACSLPGRSPDGRRAGPALFHAPVGGSPVTLCARSLDHAVDSPCLVAAFHRLEWQVEGVPHGLALDGLRTVAPPARLADDLTAIVRAAAAVFGGPLPYERYLFLCLFAAEGHGGLEHAESTTLLASRAAWKSDKGYREFLSLAAHELFHAWNVKRMRPVEFWRYDYENENYSALLWLVEGWTAYYDDLLCQRAGLVPAEDYLAAVARNIATMRNAPGRFRLSLAESSFDAWIRLYRPDENTRNSSQNYYGNGAIAAMCLDLLLRRSSDGASCLDDVLRDLFRRSYGAGRGYTLADVHAAVESVLGPDGVRALDAWTSGTFDPDLADLLGAFGVRLSAKDAERPHLGITFDAGKTTIASVQADAPAHRAGLAPGDEILALQDLRVDSERWQEVFQAVAAIGAPLEVLLARRGAILRRTAVPEPGPGTPVLEVDPKADPRQVALREGWLRPTPPAS